MRCFFFMPIFFLITVCRAAAPDYGAPVTLATDVGSAYSIATGDFDQDGDKDFVLAIWDQNMFAWYESNGGKTPQFTRRNLISASAAHDVVVADLNGDAWPDIVGISGDKLYWFRNLCTVPATFQTITLDSACTGGWNASLVDLNNDGMLDILAASYGNNTVAYYRNLGAGAFSRINVTTHTNAIFVRGADVDRDGLKDVIVSSSNDKKLLWFKNLGNGLFSENLISTEGWSIEIADLNKDGWTDFIAIGGGTNTVSFYRNNGASGTVSFTKFLEHPYTGPQSIWVEDFDYDGDADVLLASSTNRNVLWFENRGDATFDIHTISLGTSWTWNASTCDWDGDGDRDIIGLGTNRVLGMQNLGIFNAARGWAVYE